MKSKNKTLAVRIRNVILVLILTLLVLALIGGLSFSIYAASVTESEIDETLFELLSSNTASKIYY